MKYSRKRINFLSTLFTLITVFALTNAYAATDVTSTYKKYDSLRMENQCVTYDVDFKEKEVETTFDSKAIFKSKDNKKLLLKLPNQESRNNYSSNQTAKLLYKDAAKDADGNTYNVEVTIDNIKLFSYKHKSSNVVSYISLCDISKGLWIESYCYNSNREKMSSRNLDDIIDEPGGINYDVTFKIIDNNGAIKEGKYVLYTTDIDVGYNYSKGYTGNTKFNEGVNFVSGFEADTIHLLKNSSLSVENDNGKIRIKPIKGLDSNTEKSGFSVIADAKENKITWTAGQYGCGTNFNKLGYDPYVIEVEKQDSNSGDIIPGAELGLFKDDKSLTSWTTTETSNKILLTSGTYTLKEDTAPTGYEIADNLEVTVNSDGKILVGGEAVDKVIMKDNRKNAKIIVHHYLINESGEKTTTKAPSITGGNCEDVIMEKRFLDPYDTVPADVQTGYSLVEISGDKEGIVQSEEVVIIYYYRKDSGKVIVRYIDEVSGDEIANPEHLTGEIGEEYITEGKTISGYKLTKIPENSEGTYVEGTIEVIYYYKPIGFELKKDEGHHEWYLRGYEDYTFRMNRFITREEIATIFYRLTTVTDNDMRQDFVIKEKPYTDVEIDRWSARPIAYMKQLGIMGGYADGSFRPDQPITRAEIAQVIMQYVVSPQKNDTMFSDLPSNHWASTAVSFATNEGWIIGYEDGTYRPDNNLTRVEIVTIVNRMLGRELADEEVERIQVPLVDLDKDHWGYKNVLEAITSHDCTLNEDGKEIWSDYRYPFHEDMSQDAYNDV